MAIRTDSELRSLYFTSSGEWPDNIIGDITPADLRSGVLDTYDTSYNRTAIKQNRDGYLYIYGDVDDEGSLRFNMNTSGNITTIEKYSSGVWNSTSFKAGAASVFVGERAAIASAGHHLLTEDKDGHYHFHTHLTYDGELSSGIAGVPQAYKYTSRKILQPDNSGLFTGTLFQYAFPVTVNSFVKTTYFQTGPTAASAPIRTRVYEGTDDTGLLNFDHTFPASAFPANTEIKLAIDGFFEFDKGKIYFMKLESAAPFSMKANAGVTIPWFAADASDWRHNDVLDTIGWEDGATFEKGQLSIQNRQLYACSISGIQSGTFQSNIDKWGIVATNYGDPQFNTLNVSGRVDFPSGSLHIANVDIDNLHTSVTNYKDALYIRGDENYLNGFRFSLDGDIPVIQKNISGAWQKTEMEFAAGSIFIGKNLKISAAGHELMTERADDTKRHLYARSTYSGSETGTEEVKIVDMEGLNKVVVIVNNPGEISGTSLWLKITSSFNQMLKDLIIRTGSQSATDNVLVTCFEGDESFTGPIVWEELYPAETFKHYTTTVNVTNSPTTPGRARFNITPSSNNKIFEFQEVTMSGFTTNPGYNGTYYANGGVEASGSWFEITTIAYGSDESGDFFTREAILPSKGLVQFEPGSTYTFRFKSSNTFSLGRFIAYNRYKYHYNNFLVTKEWTSGDTYNKNQWHINHDTRSIYVCNVSGVQTGTFASNASKWDKLSTDVYAKKQLTTGLLAGGAITQTGATTVSWTAGNGMVVNSNNPNVPVVTDVEWNAVSGFTPTNIATDGTTVIGYNSAGALIEKMTYELNAEDYKDYISFGSVTHNSGIIIKVVDTPANLGYDPGSYRDFVDMVIGPANIDGNKYTTNGANLQLDVIGGNAYIYGSNFRNNPKVSDIVTLSSGSGISFSRVYRDTNNIRYESLSTNAIDPTQYDTGSGYLTPVASGYWTIQRIFRSRSGGTFVAYGQQQFATRELALAAVGNEYFVEQDPLPYTLFRSSLMVSSNATALNDTAQAEFFNQSSFRAFGAHSSTSSTIPGITTPGGPTGSVQFNNNSTFDGESSFTYNTTTNTLSIDNISSTSIIGTTLSGVTNGNFLGQATGDFTGKFYGTLSGNIHTETTAVTQAAGDNSTRIATTAYVANAVNIEDHWNSSGNLLYPSEPDKLVTVSGLKVDNDTTMNGKLDVSGIIKAYIFDGELSGVINSDTTAITQPTGDGSTKVATTAYVDNAVTAEDLWDRTDTTLTPKNSNDSLSGVNNIDITGSLYQTVFGDETGLVFNVQFTESGINTTQYDKSQYGIQVSGVNNVSVSANAGEFGYGTFIPSASRGHYTLGDVANLPYGASPRSIEVLFKPSDSSINPLFNYGFLGAAFQTFGIAAWSENLAFQRAGQNYTIMGAISLLNKWTHVVLMYDGTNIICYANGKKFYEASEPTVNTVRSGSNIGRDGVNSDWNYNGYIDYIKVYNRVLDESEIRSHYLRHGGDSVIKSDNFRVLNTNNQVNLHLDASGTLDVPGTAKITGDLIHTTEYSLKKTLSFNPLTVPNVYTQYLGTYNIDGVVEIMVTDSGVAHGASSYFNVSRMLSGVPSFNVSNDSTSSTDYSLSYRIIDDSDYELFLIDNSLTNSTINYTALMKTNGTFTDSISALNDTGIVDISPLLSIRGNLGKVGVSQRIPEHKLDVGGNALIRGSATEATLFVYTQGNYIKATINDVFDMFGQNGINFSTLNNYDTLSIKSGGVTANGPLTISGDATVYSLSPNTSVFTDGSKKLISHPGSGDHGYWNLTGTVMQNISGTSTLVYHDDTNNRLQIDPSSSVLTSPNTTNALNLFDSIITLDAGSTAIGMNTTYRRIYSPDNSKVLEVNDTGITYNNNTISTIGAIERDIHSVSDLTGLESGGVITVSSPMKLNIKANIASSGTYVLNGASLTIDVLEGQTYTYTGSGTLISGTGGCILRNGRFYASSTGTLFGISNINPSTNIISLENVQIYNWSLGEIDGAVIFIRSGSSVIAYKDSLRIKNYAAFKVIDFGYEQFVTTNKPMYDIRSAYTGGTTLVQFAGVTGGMKPGESLLNIEPCIDGHSNFQISVVTEGRDGILFDTSGISGIFTAVADASIGTTNITAVSNFNGRARFAFTGPTVYVGQEVIISGFITNVAYNGTWPISNTDGTSYFDCPNITYGSSESGSFTSNSVTFTETGTALSNGDCITVDTNYSTVYDVGSVVYNKQTNSFQANAPFSVSTSGIWDTKSLDHDSKYVAVTNAGKSTESSTNCSIYTNGNTATTSTTGGGSWDPLNVNYFTEGSSTSRFKLINIESGEIEYTGIVTFRGNVACSISAFKSSASAVDHKFRLYKTVGTGAFDIIEPTRALTDSLGSLSLVSPVLLNPGDRFRVEIASQGAATTVTVQDLSLTTG